jgi:hypothetical protein
MVAKAKEPFPWGGLNVRGKREYRLHPGQSKVLKSTTRFTAAIAGTGGGKTVLGPLWILRRIKKLVKEGMTEGMIGMVIAPTYKILSRATVPTLVDTLRGTEYEGRFLESKGQYILPRGLGKLYLLSADNPNGLEGGQLNIGAWLDEAGQMKYSAWLALCRRTGVNEAPVFITTTPYLNNWLKTEFLDNFIAGDPDYFCVIWASNENPAYPQAEYERAKRTLPKATFEMMYGGLFTGMEGLVYPGLPLCYRRKRITGGRRVGGIDFGWRAPFCGLSGIMYVQDGERKLHLDFERYKATTRLQTHIDSLPPNGFWFADPSAPESIDKMIDNGIMVVKGNNSIMEGIEAVNEMIITGRLSIDPRCKNLLAEGTAYQFPQDLDKEEKSEIPVGGLDHAMDALRYLCMGIRVATPSTVARTVMTRRSA